MSIQNTAPERIWLNTGISAEDAADTQTTFHDLAHGETSWHSSQIDTGDTEYVRADLMQERAIEFGAWIRDWTEDVTTADLYSQFIKQHGYDQ